MMALVALQLSMFRVSSEGILTPPLNLVSRLVTQHFLRNHFVQDTIVLGTMHRVRFAQGWPWWFEQHLDIRVCGVKLREHFAGFHRRQLHLLSELPAEVELVLGGHVSAAGRHRRSLRSIAWGTWTLASPDVHTHVSNVCYQIHFTNFVS